MTENKTHYEYVYRPEPSVKMTAARILLITMYSVFCAMYIILFWISLQSLALLILLPFIMFAMIRMTWRLVNTEYEVSVEAGELTVAVIYGKAARRVKFRYTVREMTVITAYDKAHVHLYSGNDISDTRCFGKSADSENAIVCVCPDVKKNSRKAVVFEGDDEMRRILRLSNPSAVKA